MPQKERTNTKKAIGNNVAFRLYDLATGEDDARLCRDIPESQCREQPWNFLYQVLAQALSKIGDALADSKVVLPWVLGSVSAPVFFIGLLVPIRESLALLPQVLIGGVIRRFPIRKGFWIASSVVEGTCVILMGIVAALGVVGSAAGWTIIILLVFFSLARGIASIAAKDTLGKTVSKGRRGRVSGYAATISGIVAAVVGIYLALSPGQSRPDWLLYSILIAAGSFWFLAAAVFALIREIPGATSGGQGVFDLVKHQTILLFKDSELQKFLIARALMVSTALVGPVYVALAQRETGQTLDNLGWLIISTGLAGALSSSVWGILSDRSSRLTMSVAALIAAALGIFVLAILAVAPVYTHNIAFYSLVLFVLGIAHAGVRIGRKTHIVDLASGDKKAEYVAISNTFIGLVLIVLGTLSSFFISYSLEIGLVVMTILSLLGAGMCLTIKHVQS